jgi:IS605 OrfB family transposase
MEYRTYNIELTMSEETHNYWMKLLSDTRDAFNRCAIVVSDNNVPYGLKQFHDATYSILREEFPLIPAQGVIKVYKSVLAALRSIRSNKHNNADIPQKRSLSLQLDKRLYSNLSVNGISLGNGQNQKREKCTFVLYDKVRELFDTCTFKDPTIFARDDRLFLSIPFEVVTPPVKGDNAIGVDLGMKRLFVTSDGLYYTDKEYLKRRRQLRYLKRCLQGKNTRSSKKHLAKVRRKERNISKDMLHRATNALLRSTAASIIVVEDLKKIKYKTSRTKEGFKRIRHNNALSQVPLADFREMLTHKATLVGKQVVSVSPTWTSQMDSRNGKRDGERHGCRYYCSDGIVLDSDWNAAVNIALRAKHPTSTCLPIDGKLTALVGKVSSMTSTSRT